MAFSLGGFAAALLGAGLHMERSEHEAIEKAAEILEKEAKSYPGKYQPGWAPLGPSAIAKHGDTPLLDIGRMRDSIEHQSSGREAWVGSNDKVLIYQEMGTSRGIPPRPVLGLAAVKKEKEICEEIGRKIMQSLVL